ncbi:DUF6412 domain-containing protein [Streptomyces sp. NPDC060194]|uniref:DUF6412 domain-containing protein n=1 Tax=Streptomyces sp. NPDC060194 TaxID=3347069 RepID=UPI003649F954
MSGFNAYRQLRLLGLLAFLLVNQLLVAETGIAAAVTVAATAAAGAAIAACAVGAVLCAPRVPPHRIRTAIRDRELRTAFLPQRDPDARGRRRPRAPGGPLLTAG